MNNCINLKKQNGMATLLIVMIIGMILTVSTLTVVYSNRSTQEKQVSAHALTHAQAGVWGGAEVFRNYFHRLGKADRADLLALTDQTFNVPAGDGNIYSITIKDYDPATDRAKAEITFKDLKAKSASKIEVVVSGNVEYQVPEHSSGAMNFYSDVTFTGGITVDTDPGQNRIRVDGDINLTNIGKTGLEEVESTGTITANSSAHFTYLKSNEDIFLNNGASADTAFALGHIQVDGSGGYIRDIGHANEWVYDMGYGSDMPVIAGYKGTNIFSAGKMRRVNPDGTYVIDEDDDYLYDYQDMVFTDTSIYTSGRLFENLSSNALIKTSLSTVSGKVSTLGNVELYGNGQSTRFTNEIEAVGLISCRARWNEYSKMSTELGYVFGCGTDGSGTYGGEAYTNELNLNSTLNLAEVPLVEKFVIEEKPIVDVWTLEKYANYSFSYDSSGKIVINIRNMSTIDDGWYSFFNGVANDATGRNKQQQLCKIDVDVNGAIVRNADGDFTCTDKLSKSLCVWNVADPDNSGNGGCFGYNAGTNRWSINGNTIAPGVYFFEGNLNVQTNMAHATLLATLNIDTAGAAVIKALNYASVDALCRNIYSAIGDVPLGSTGEFDGVYPKNYCEDASGAIVTTLNYSVVGNVVLGAGGTNPDLTENPDEDYEGGDISLGASTIMFGTVMAGDNLATSGATVIHGHVVALNNSNAANPNNITASFELDLSDAPESYNRYELPSVVNVCLEDATNNYACSHPQAGSSATIIKNETNILWAKYL